MAPRSSFSASGASISRSGYSGYSSALSGGQSISVLSQDDPAEMSPEAIRAELRYYAGTSHRSIRSREELEDALRFARKRANSPSGGAQQPQAAEYNAMGMRVQHDSPGVDHGTGGNNSGGGGSTQIPLTSSNRIPPQILTVIKSNADPKMREISMDRRRIGDREVTKLADALAHNTTVTYLSLVGCDVTDAALGRVARMLGRNGTLAELRLDQNRITGDGAGELADALRDNTTLGVLTLSRNPDVGDDGAEQLASMLAVNGTVHTLDVAGCGIARHLEDEIDELLAERSEVDANFESLLERLLDDDFRVTGIDLSGRRIGNAGATRLAEALSDNTQVRQLWLRGCGIGDAGAKALASCLEQNMAVVDLFLADNAVGDAGVGAILDALAASNSTLVSLELDGNPLTDAGVDAFLACFGHNTSVLVATFNGCDLDDPSRLAMLESRLTERRDGLNMVSFVVDPDAASEGGAGSGIINMSVCSSYMPSTYRRAGFHSQAGSAANQRKPASHSYSAFNKSKTSLLSGRQGQGIPPSPIPASPPEGTERSASPRRRPQPPPRRQVGERSVEAPLAGEPSPQSRASYVSSYDASAVMSGPISEASPSPSLATRSADMSNSLATRSESQSMGASAASSARQSSGDRGYSPGFVASPAEPQHRQHQPKPDMDEPERNPNHVPSQAYRQANVPVPIKSQPLETIAESQCSEGSGSQGRPSAAGIRGGVAAVSVASASQLDNLDTYPVVEFPDSQSHAARSKLTAPTAARTEATGVVLVPDGTVQTSVKDPETQRNFNLTIQKLYRRVGMMKRVNHVTCAHFRSRHFWFSFVPTSACIVMTLVLGLTGAAGIKGEVQLAIALSTAGFALAAFGLNALQAQVGWSSRARVHRSAELELSQVAFRLDTLQKFEGDGLSTDNYSTAERANAIRDLYRIDVYLQAMQRCTPDAPVRIAEAFSLLSSRLKHFCLKYPNTVRRRTPEYGKGDEPVDPENPVPEEMHFDAMELLENEISRYALYPVFLPNPRETVSRTIDMFFSEQGAPPRSYDRPNDRHHGDGYTHDGYTQDGYTDDGYTHDGYTDDGYTHEGGYTHGGYGDEEENSQSYYSDEEGYDDDYDDGYHRERSRYR